ncbi:MAG: SCO family protein [Planctomycetota bacterium]
MGPRCALVLLLAALAGPAVAQAQEASRIVREVGIDQRLGEEVSLDLPFVDESGRDVRIGDYFDDRPVILVFVYNRCPMLCSQVLNGLVHSLRPIDLDPGEDFEIVTVSIDPRESTELAARKKSAYVEEYGRAGAEKGWHFLVGGEDSIRRLTEEVGFRYVYDPATDEFAHASGFVVLTPGGVLSRYFYGLENPAGDLRLALIESSEGRIGSLVDQVLLLCYHYDPTTGRYGFAIMSALRALGVLTVLAIAAFVGLMLHRGRRTPRLQAGG